MSRRPSVITPETQESAALNSEAKDQNSTCLCKPSAQEPDSTEKTEENMKEEVDDKETKTESSSADETPANMEVDSKEKQGMTSLNL